MKWSPFEHEVYRGLSSYKGGSILVGLSGGADSVCLSLILKAFASPLDLKLHFFHCHHGPGLKEESQVYRDQALEFCKDFCQKHDFHFSFVRYQGQEVLKSEADLRDFRHSHFEKLQMELGFQYRATGHHLDDLLETRILRLIRGSGLKGLEGFHFQDGLMIRPLISQKREDILAYLAEKSEAYIEDPSNSEDIYLRNWLRNDWLPQLEAKIPGSKMSLGRSLSLILDEVNSEISQGELASSLEMTHFLTLTGQQRQTLIARYLMSLGIRNFSRGQIEEILKQLDKSHNEHRFIVCGLEWGIDAGRIVGLPKAHRPG